MWLNDVAPGEDVTLEAMDAVPAADLEALMERGVLPGSRLRLLRRSPFGDPIVRVEGTVLALRRELASCMAVRRAEGESDPW